MNRRQAKKASKKVIFPMGDEMNLLTLIPEEYEKTMKDFYHYVQKYCCYKHYRDRYKKGRLPFGYHFPVGEGVRKQFEQVLNMVGDYHVEPTVVMQSLEQVKKKLSSQNRRKLINKITYFRYSKLCSNKFQKITA